jgi:uracil-DNA glycosylase family 4
MPNAWDRLNRRIIECRQCPRLVAHREHIAHVKRRQFLDWEYWGRPVPGFGDRGARLLIVGLAPAAHGANRTGRIFTGDRSGDWLYDALYDSDFANQPLSTERDDGLELRDAFVTAIARCAPPGNRPTPEELGNCRPYLVEELGQLTRVRVVLALGQLAMTGFLHTWQERGGGVPSPRPRFGHGRVFALGSGVTLLTSYHPSQQNTFTGRLTRRMFRGVLRRARALVDAPLPTS